MKDFNLRRNLAIGKSKRIASLIAFTFVGSYLIAIVIFPFPILQSQYNGSLAQVLAGILGNFLFCAVLVLLCLYIDDILNKKVSWTAQPLKRLFIQAILLILGILFLVSLVGLLSIMFWNPKPLESYQTNLRLSLLYLLSIVCWAFLISTINNGVYMLKNWKRTSIKAMEYKLLAAQNRQLAAQRELQALRLQLDPHFVFNNLSALSELILKDQRLGYEYTENFSKVYRYLLVNSKRTLISLAEEMNFLKAYQFLIKHRLGGGCRFHIDIDESKLHLKIPPITLQLLIENALKHNRKAEDNPLVITITLTDSDELEVSNNLVPLAKNLDSTGMGLQNLADRYRLLGGNTPVIEKNDAAFNVTITLFQ